MAPASLEVRRNGRVARTCPRSIRRVLWSAPDRPGVVALSGGSSGGHHRCGGLSRICCSGGRPMAKVLCCGSTASWCASASENTAPSAVRAILESHLGSVMAMCSDIRAAPCASVRGAQLRKRQSAGPDPHTECAHVPHLCVYVQGGNTRLFVGRVFK